MTEKLTDEERKQIELTNNLRKQGPCRLCKCGRFISLDLDGRYVNHPKSFFNMNDLCEMSGLYPKKVK